MNIKSYHTILLILLMFAFKCCTKEWEDHYTEAESSVNVKLWDTLKSSGQFSEFVKYLELFHLDTIISSDKVKTLFVPTNEAMNEFLAGDTTGLKETMTYHIIPTYYMIRNVGNNQHQRLITFGGKFALIQNLNQSYYIDGIEILSSSPMFLDGKYYQIRNVAVPKPNIYEYIKWNNTAVQKYIDLQNIVLLDKELSKVLGFNDQGQTVYDSVTTVVNSFEVDYFAISKEYSNIYATLVIPGKENYENALNEMAQNLGGNYSTFEDIPNSWENNVLIPALLHKGIYGGLLGELDFLNRKLPNVAGDTIIVDFEIDPASRYICSNGLVYDYKTFSVGDSLYKIKILEAEDLCYNISTYQYAWFDDKVTVTGDKRFQPVKEKISSASNDTIVRINFGSNYQQPYSIKFKINDVFPKKYRLVWRTNYLTTGIFSIHVNGKIVKLGISNYDEYDTSKLTSGFFSVLGYKIYPDKKGFSDLDGWVENLTEFGDVTIEIKYSGPGQSSDNGLIFDYLALESE